MSPNSFGWNSLRSAAVSVGTLTPGVEVMSRSPVAGTPCVATGVVANEFADVADEGPG